MTKNVNKRLGKAPAASSTPATPMPFLPAPANLSAFTSYFDKDLVYITHFDRHPVAFKQQIFTVPVLLNFAIVIGLVWRIYYVLPWYFSLVATFSQGPTLMQQSFDGKVLFAILRRVVTFIIDYALITIVAPWPWSFFLESPGNPVSWRRKAGFRPSEIIVRVSRKWGREELMGGMKKGGESPFFKTRLLPALMPPKMQKTGYLLMDKDFDLDFALMVTATQLLDKDTLKEYQLERRVFVWHGSETTGQWLVWDEKAFAEQATEAVEEMQEASNTEHREKIFKIQAKMQEIGKEDLFFKWVELIQYESTRPGGFTQERQLEAGAKVQKLFEEHGVDLEEFEKMVGGMS